MSDINLRRVLLQNPIIAAEYAKHGSVVAPKQEPVFRRKAKSDETRAREAAERRYVRRSNICGSCHMAKPVGSRVCEECE